MRNLSAGAISLARWMKGRGSAESFYGVHVVEYFAAELLAEIDPRTQTEDLEALGGEALAPLHDDVTFAEVGLMSASAAEDGITAAAGTWSCDALIIGRRKHRDAVSLVRLGRVARRLLRTLPFPVVVVPPDLREQDIRGGPILLATDLESSSTGAAHFARALAPAVNLDMLVTHVSPVSGSNVLVPQEQWSMVIARALRESREALAQWVKEHDLGSARTSVVHGSVGHELDEVARVSGASMLVMGSRGISTLNRLFLPSNASELAASAKIPVAVIPDNWQPR